MEKRTKAENAAKDAILRGITDLPISQIEMWFDQELYDWLDAWGYIWSEGQWVFIEDDQ